VCDAYAETYKKVKEKQNFLAKGSPSLIPVTFEVHSPSLLVDVR
jgi:hypothetical protein